MADHRGRPHPLPRPLSTNLRPLLYVTLVFITVLGGLTVFDISLNGVTPLDVVSLMIIGFFAVAAVNALRVPPKR